MRNIHFATSTFSPIKSNYFFIFKDTIKQIHSNNFIFTADHENIYFSIANVDRF